MKTLTDKTHGDLDMITDTASIDRAQAIAEAGKIPVWMTTEQLMTITGILSARAAQCRNDAESAISADARDYWLCNKLEAEAMRELLRAAL